jgi:LAGLIDADG DNA endonuclease family protein
LFYGSRTQGSVELIRVVEHPRTAICRVPPDPVEFQVILGSLLGDGRLVGVPRQRRLRIAHRAERRDYVLWKYDRLGAFPADPPTDYDGGLVGFETVIHPLFDDLARLFGDRFARHDVIERLLRPLGLAVWLSDVGRLEMRAGAFSPGQRELAVAS